MKNILEIQNLSILVHKEVENLNRPTTSDNVSVLKSPSAKKEKRKEKKFWTQMFILNNSPCPLSPKDFYLCVCLCMPCVYRCPQKPKEGIRSPGSRIKAALRQTMWMLGANLQYSRTATSKGFEPGNHLPNPSLTNYLKHLKKT